MITFSSTELSVPSESRICEFQVSSVHSINLFLQYLQVNPKRTNRPGISTTNRGGPVFRTRGMRSRGYRGASYMYGYRPIRRGRYVSLKKISGCAKGLVLALKLKVAGIWWCSCKLTEG